MSMITNFKHIPGQNDAEYIDLLEKVLAMQKEVDKKAFERIDDLINRKELLKKQMIIYDDDGIGYKVVKVKDIEKADSIQVK